MYNLRRVLCPRLSRKECLRLGCFAIVLLFYFLYRQRASLERCTYFNIKNKEPNPKLNWEHRVRVVDTEALKKFMDEEQDALVEHPGVVRNKADKYVRDIGYKHHAFNALVSNNLGQYRKVPDTRHKVCPRAAFDAAKEELLAASIIMCFYNEHRMTLFRSIRSVLERTPAALLREIILVDDNSDLPELEFHLAAELRKEFKFKNLHYRRNEMREGLIRSRVVGAREALGDVLVFLDSHIEVNEQWLEPLLRLIKQENATLAVPVIDLINPDTFEYTSSPLVRGGFNWGLHYKWENLPEGTLKTESDFKGPFRSPTMAGGLFAVNRQFFKHIGEYDMGMDIWGGENIEISFRTWQCGGAIKIVPCSRVGHIFRKRRPYSAPNGDNTMQKNSLRLAHVWMDDYKQYYLEHEKLQSNEMDFGDISERQHLRAKLKCQDFAWYLKHVYPELRLPGEQLKKSAAAGMPKFQPWHSRKRNYVNSFMMRLSDTELCASVIEPKVKGFWKKGSSLTLQPCLKTRNQIWYETEKSEIILDKLLCLEAVADSQVLLAKCHEMMGDQQWRHTSNEYGPIYNMASGTCLRAVEPKIGAAIILDLCSKAGAGGWDILHVKQLGS